MKEKKNQTGVTIVSLVITVIVLMIVAGIGVKVGTDQITKTKDNTVVSELSMVQHAILEQYTKYKTTKNANYLVGNMVSGEELNSITSTLGVTLVTVPSSYSEKERAYYKLDKASLLEIGIKNTDDEYVVNYISGEVMNITKKATSEGNALYVRAKSF